MSLTHTNQLIVAFFVFIIVYILLYNINIITHVEQMLYLLIFLLPKRRKKQTNKQNDRKIASKRLPNCFLNVCVRFMPVRRYSDQHIKLIHIQLSYRITYICITSIYTTENYHMVRFPYSNKFADTYIINKKKLYYTNYTNAHIRKHTHTNARAQTNTQMPIGV